MDERAEAMILGMAPPQWSKEYTGVLFDVNRVNIQSTQQTVSYAGFRGTIRTRCYPDEKMGSSYSHQLHFSRVVFPDREECKRKLLADLIAIRCLPTVEGFFGDGILTGVKVEGKTSLFLGLYTDLDKEREIFVPASAVEPLTETAIEELMRMEVSRP